LLGEGGGTTIRITLPMLTPDGGGVA